MQKPRDNIEDGSHEENSNGNFILMDSEQLNEPRINNQPSLQNNQIVNSPVDFLSPIGTNEELSKQHGSYLHN
jgi:hypothetical protein